MAVKLRLKLLVGWAAAVLGLLTLLSPFLVSRVQVSVQMQWWPRHQLGEAVKHIQTHGITPELNDLLAQGPKPSGWKWNYVTTAHPLMLKTTPAPEVVFAASRPELVGKSVPDAWQAVSGSGGYSSGDLVTAPDGTAYSVWMAGTMDRDPEQLAIAGAITVAALAWLALAAWIFLDVRERGKNAALGWLLLGLLAGPLALAVWLIYRYAQEGGKPAPACPGCGADTVRDAAFCVRCGHALRPACPDCRRPVGVDWAYCGTCGGDLSAS